MSRAQAPLRSVRGVAMAVAVMTAVHGSVAAQPRAEDVRAAERDLAVLHQARDVFAATTDPGSVTSPFGTEGPRLHFALATSSPIAIDMTRRLEAVAAATDPAVLEAAYRVWRESRRLDVFAALVQTARLMNEKRIRASEMDAAAWRNLITVSLGIVKAAEVPAGTLGEADLSRLKAALWRVRFVEPARSAPEKIAPLQAAIGRIEAAMALEREVADVKRAVADAVKTGRPDAAVEQRLAALPAERRAEIERTRAEQQASQEAELARARAEQEKQEATLRRQREIDDAVRQRRQEIETGKADARAEEARRRDPGLRRAVEDWERAYRTQQAARKADDAKRQIAEAERQKVEEQRRREAEETARRARAAAEQREARLRRFNVVATVTGDELVVNPFRYQDRAVVLVAVRFKRMLDRGVGVFGTLRGEEVVVTGLPSDLFTTAGEARELVVRVKGKFDGTNSFGAPLSVPHVQYVDTP